MEVLDFLTLFGGLAFFLFGMSVLSSGLEKMAGGGLERTLKNVTSSPLKSFMLGAGITIAIQSSSAMTVMLVGLVNSGIMGFEQTIGVILGSNVGTTLTSWLLSLMGISENGSFSLINLLQPKYFSPILAFVGIAIITFAKKDKRKEIGNILIGFAILMYGMEFMSSSVGKVSEMPQFTSLLTAFDSPIVAVLISTVFTGIIQSSAATVGIVQALALTGSISYKMAIPLVLGANIGTCMTALLSAISANKRAKRVVAVHIYIKVIGTAVCLVCLAVISMIPSCRAFLSGPTTTYGVAIIHTLFNVVNTAIMYPLKNLLIRIAKLTVSDKNTGNEKTVFLDERLLNTPPMAIAECRRLTTEMASMARDSLFAAIQLLDGFDRNVFESVTESEDLIDRYEDKLGTFLVKISAKELTDESGHQVGRLLHAIGDFERIGDHALNIAEVAKEIYDKNISFSSDAHEEINVITAAVKEILTNAVESFINDDIELAKCVEPLEQVIDSLRDELKTRHVERVQRGKCTIEMGFVFSDLLTNYERVSDHCSNIAVYTVQMHSSKLDTHKYLRSIKTGSNEEFKNTFIDYESKYSLFKE